MKWVLKTLRIALLKVFCWFFNIYWRLYLHDWFILFFISNSVFSSWRTSCCSSSHCGFLISHLLMELKEELIKLCLLFNGFLLSFSNLSLRVKADTNAEENLETEYNNNANSVACKLYTINIDVAIILCGQNSSCWCFRWTFAHHFLNQEWLSLHAGWVDTIGRQDILHIISMGLAELRLSLIMSSYRLCEVARQSVIHLFDWRSKYLRLLVQFFSNQIGFLLSKLLTIATSFGSTGGPVLLELSLRFKHHAVSKLSLGADRVLVLEEGNVILHIFCDLREVHVLKSISWSLHTHVSLHELADGSSCLITWPQNLLEMSTSNLLSWSSCYEHCVNEWSNPHIF